MRHNRTAESPGFPAMLEADLRRAILCERKGQLVQRPGEAPDLIADCPGDCLAHLLGWHGIYLTPLQDTHKRWRTPARGDWGPGWPDLQLVSPRQGRVLYAELKRDRSLKPRPEQMAVLMGLRIAGQEVHVWTPAELDDGSIYRALGGRGGLHVVSS